MLAVGQILARSLPETASWTLVSGVRSLHALMVAPSLLFLATMTVMLFRPPDIQLYWLDRVALLLLVFVVLSRALVLHQSLRVGGLVTWPMLGLLLLSFFSLCAQPYEPQNWSMFAAKWAVPFILYNLSGFVFDDASSLRKLEIFAIVVLAYLSLIAILFLFDAKDLIFPRYILDESIGIHSDRARGPFLQAVANGVTLNLLGLIALDSFRRRRLQGLLALLFAIALPLAVLATETRAVWLSFAGSAQVLAFFSPSPRVRRACLCLTVAAGIAVIAALSFQDANRSFNDRLEERSPVEFRVVMYRAGLEMFLEKPFLGWGAKDVQPGLAKRVHDFHQKAFFFHNTYLEIAVEHGAAGLALYLWLVIDLLRLGGRRRPHVAPPPGSFLDDGFRSLWPVLVAVYLLNASFVVMNYQFVNGLLFTLAGLLAAQNRKAEAGFDALRS